MTPMPPKQPKPFKFSGMIAADDRRHQTTRATTANTAPEEHYLAPTTISVTIVQPPGIGTIGVPQYGTPVNGGSPNGFQPATDANGNFMSAKFQPNNNCYAYGCNIASNTFPQPGRKSGYKLVPSDFQQSLAAIGEKVAGYASKDGLILVGRTMSDLMTFKSSRQGTNPGPGQLGAGFLGGHFVALMISPAGDADWQGDYHWARCDNSSGGCDSWSQKDGGDQVTNFDFAGNPITDPSTANWTVNQGPLDDPKSPDNNEDQLVSYGFYCYMFVPDGAVNIL